VSVAVAKAAMPGFNIGGARGVESNIRVMWTRMGYERGEVRDKVEVTFTGNDTTSNNSIAAVGDPAGLGVEVAGVARAVVDSQDGDEADFGSGDV
jgi:hypothetical protein